jgi:hypothetical protein
MNRIDPFSASYDAESDVLYISRNHEVAVRGVEDESGVVWRYDEHGVLIGATVMDFREAWLDRLAALSDEISSRFDAPAREIAAAIDDAVDDRRGYLRAGLR